MLDCQCAHIICASINVSLICVGSADVLCLALDYSRLCVCLDMHAACSIELGCFQAKSPPKLTRVFSARDNARADALSWLHSARFMHKTCQALFIFNMYTANIE